MTQQRGDDEPNYSDSYLRNRRQVRDRVANLVSEEHELGEVNWEAIPHAHLWRMIQGAWPSAMGRRAATWAQLGKDISEATEDVHRVMDRLMGSWRGKGARAAAESAADLLAWGADASSTSETIGVRLDEYNDAVQRAQREMPEPVHPGFEHHFRNGYDIDAFSGPAGVYLLDQLLDDHQPTKAEQWEAKKEAVRVMQVYERSSKDVYRAIPQFKPAPRVTSETATDADAAVAGTTPASSTAAALSAGNPGTVSAPPTAGLTGGGAGGVSNPGNPAGGPVSGVGSGSGSATAAAARVANGLAGARSGIGPGYGMFPPMAGQGANGEQDREHRVRYGDKMDLMDDLPPAYPAVIGDD